MTSKLKQLREKIIEANPEIIINKNAQLIKFDHSVVYFEQKRPITFEDVLIALKEKGRECYYANLNEIARLWQLGIDLDHQSSDTINFLIKLLV